MPGPRRARRARQSGGDCALVEQAASPRSARRASIGGWPADAYSSAAGRRIEHRVTDGREVGDVPTRARKSSSRPSSSPGPAACWREPRAPFAAAPSPRPPRDLADDVPDGQRDAAVRQLERVVPVAADLEHVAARLVAAPRRRSRELDEPRRSSARCRPIAISRSSASCARSACSAATRSVMSIPVGCRKRTSRLVPDRVHREVDDALAAVRHPVAAASRGTPRRPQPLDRDADTRLTSSDAAPPGRLPERTAEHLVARVSAPVDGQLVDLADVAFEIQDAGEDPGLVEDRLELGGRRAQRLVRLLARRDVAGDLRGADDPP